MNSFCTKSLNSGYSMSSRASKTSNGIMVFLFELSVLSFALYSHVSVDIPRSCPAAEKPRATHAFARWFMNTVAAFVMASIALAWICVFGGKTPLANRVMMDLGRFRSCTPTLLDPLPKSPCHTEGHNGQEARTSIATVSRSFLSLGAADSLARSTSISEMSAAAAGAGVVGEGSMRVELFGAIAMGAGEDTAAAGSLSAGATLAIETSLRRDVSLLRGMSGQEHEFGREGRLRSGRDRGARYGNGGCDGPIARQEREQGGTKVVMFSATGSQSVNDMVPIVW